MYNPKCLLHPVVAAAAAVAPAAAAALGSGSPFTPSISNEINESWLRSAPAPDPLPAAPSSSSNPHHQTRHRLPSNTTPLLTPTTLGQDQPHPAVSEIISSEGASLLTPTTSACGSSTRHPRRHSRQHSTQRSDKDSSMISTSTTLDRLRSVSPVTSKKHSPSQIKTDGNAHRRHSHHRQSDQLTTSSGRLSEIPSFARLPENCSHPVAELDHTLLSYTLESTLNPPTAPAHQRNTNDGDEDSAPGPTSTLETCTEALYFHAQPLTLWVMAAPKTLPAHLSQQPKFQVTPVSARCLVARLMLLHAALANYLTKDGVTSRDQHGVAFIDCLRQCGWTAQALTLIPPTTSFLPFQTHQFWLIIPPTGYHAVIPGDPVDVRFIFDVHFMELFTVARPTPTFEDFISRLRPEFLGTLRDMKDTLRILASRAQQSLQARGMAIPPWRDPSFLERSFLRAILDSRQIGDKFESPELQPTAPLRTKVQRFLSYNELNCAQLGFYLLRNVASSSSALSTDSADAPPLSPSSDPASPDYLCFDKIGAHDTPELPKFSRNNSSSSNSSSATEESAHSGNECEEFPPSSGISQLLQQSVWARRVMAL